jgi:site-specific recombinase XerD
MTTTSETLTSAPDGHDLVLRLAASAYLGRYTGTSRTHTESDLRLFFAWCADQHLAPPAAQRVQIERYVRWMQEVRRFKPSTVSRRMAVVTCFYHTCVIDAVLEHYPPTTSDPHRYEAGLQPVGRMSRATGRLIRPTTARHSSVISLRPSSANDDFSHKSQDSSLLHI